MKIAYVFTEVPQIAGMFPNAELDEMARRGVAIELFVLRNRPARTDEARRIESVFKVHRSPYLLSIRLLADVLSAAARRPWAFSSTVVRTILDAITAPRILIKSLGVLPKAFHFAAIARRRRVTLVHAYWASLPALGASVMARFADLPFSTWAHAGGDIYNRNHQTDAALESRLREARYVLTCNRANLEHFRSLAGSSILKKVELLSHGVDLDRFAPAPCAIASDRPVILAVGRLDRAKGYEFLLDACRLLADDGRAFVCKIAGTGVMAAELEKRRDALGLSERVMLLGHVHHTDLPRLYSEARIFVVPSVIGPKGSRDGLPNVLLEAMATALACVGSEVASIPEALEHEKTGLLVSPGDPRALAAAMDRLLTDAELGRRLGSAARERVRESYGRTAAMNRLHEVFRELHETEGDASGALAVPGDTPQGPAAGTGKNNDQPPRQADSDAPPE